MPNNNCGIEKTQMPEHNIDSVIGHLCETENQLRATKVSLIRALDSLNEKLYGPEPKEDTCCDEKKCDVNLTQVCNDLRAEANVIAKLTESILERIG